MDDIWNDVIIRKMVWVIKETLSYISRIECCNSSLTDGYSNLAMKTSRFGQKQTIFSTNMPICIAL